MCTQPGSRFQAPGLFLEAIDVCSQYAYNKQDFFRKKDVCAHVRFRIVPGSKIYVHTYYVQPGSFQVCCREQLVCAHILQVCAHPGFKFVT